MKARQLERSVGVGLVCMVCLVFGGTASAGSTAQAHHRAGLTTLAQKRTADLNRILKRARARLMRLARLPSVRAGDPATCNNDMAALAGSPRYGSAGAADWQGNLFCLGIPITSPVNIADRAYFLRAIGTRGFGVGDYQVGRVTGLGSIGLGFPIVVNRRATGIVLTVLSLDWLEQRIINRRPPGAVDVLVIDDHGTVLARAGWRRTRPGTNLGDKALVETMLSKEHGLGTFRLGHKPVRAAFDTVPLSDHAMHVAVSVLRD